jgi:hypothetical protein
MKILISISLTVLIVATIASAQEPAGVAHPQLRGFQEAQHIGDKQRSFFLFTAGGLSYSTRNDGWCESSSSTVLRRFFQLKMGRSGQIIRVYSAEYAGDLLLLYELSDDQFGWGYVMRFDPVKRVPRWVTPVGGYNLGPGLVEGDSVYLTAANFLAKLDLHSGRYVWQQQKMEYAPSFEWFALPTIKGEEVSFRETSTHRRVIVVEKASGKIIGVRTSDIGAIESPDVLPVRRPTTPK